MWRVEQAASWAQDRSLGGLLLPIYLVSLTVALLAGLLQFFRTDIAPLDADELEYWRLSTSLLSGAFDDPGRRTLGFPAVLAVMRMIADDFQSIQVAVMVVAATAPPLLALALLRAGADRFAALIAGLALALWPPHVFLSASLYSEALALPMLLLFFTLLPKGERAKTRSIMPWLVSGVVLGLLAHVRTMYQLFIPVVLVILLFERLPWKFALGRWAIVVAGFLAAVLPWSAYVSMKVGQPMLLTANGGETLAGGLNPQLFVADSGLVQLETRTTYSAPGKWLPVRETGFLTAEERTLPYTEQDKLLKDRAWAWIRGNPADAAYLVVRKLAYQWGVYPFWQHSTQQIVFGNIPILALSLLFLLSAARQPSALAIGARFWLMPLFVIGIAIISWGSWRFRHPADAAMIAVVATALSHRFWQTRANDADLAINRRKPVSA